MSQSASRPERAQAPGAAEKSGRALRSRTCGSSRLLPHPSFRDSWARGEQRAHLRKMEMKLMHDQDPYPKAQDHRAQDLEEERGS